MATPDADFVDLVVRIADIVGDTDADPDDNPDLAWIASGTVEVAPLYDGGYQLADGGYLAGVRRIVLTFANEGDGYARWQGKTFVRMVDLTSSKINPRVLENEATHSVEFRNLRTADGEEVRFKTRNVRLAADTLEARDDGTGTVRPVCTLARLYPLPSATPVPIYKGDRGVGVVDLVQPSPGEMALELTDGTTTDPINLPPGIVPDDATLATALGGTQAKAALSAQIVHLAAAVVDLSGNPLGSGHVVIKVDTANGNEITDIVWQGV